MYRKLRHSLQWKLMFMITAIITIVITVIGSISYDRSIKAIDSDVVRFSNQILTQANFNLSRYMDDNEHFFQRVGTSSDFRDWSSVSNGSAYSIYKNYKSIESNFIDPYIAYHREMLAIVFYSSNGYQNIYRNPENTDYMLKTDYNMKDEMWFGKLPFSGEATRLVKVSASYVDRRGFPANIPVLTYMQKFSFGNQTGYLQFDISLLSTQAILDAIKLGATGSTFIVDGNGTVITAHDQNKVGTVVERDLQNILTQNDSGSYYDKKTKQMIVYQIIPRNGWRIVSLIPWNPQIGKTEMTSHIIYP
ncbi:hypothetical protein GC102_06400 [Paenibacillus sp. LMG 31460]|uniref:Cache domain-containing protein n=1 Tax=Paenibacillus germinis TaxID=2654979 RepID=A0ABX1Z061_9BACL|nr:cache domain-containing protein [Paenibacillus germinis]NOU85411.1 hypothetical protein [Paenibacillus germinis]